MEKCGICAYVTHGFAVLHGRYISWRLCMEVEVHISCMDHQAPLANHESCNTADVSIARHSWGFTENTYSALSDLI